MNSKPILIDNNIFSSPYPERVTPNLIRSLVGETPTPLTLTPFYLYDSQTLLDKVNQMKSLDGMHHLSSYTPRYAVKANSTRAIIELLDRNGIYFDASSGFEVERLVANGVSPDKILLTSQELPGNINFSQQPFWKEVSFNASSLEQVRRIGEWMNTGHFPDERKKLSVRINPGRGMGTVGKTLTAGPDCGFGIWHENIAKLEELVNRYNLTINQLHTHIGSGGDPSVWAEVIKISFSLVEKLENQVSNARIDTINLGGGFKVARHPGESNPNFLDIRRALERELDDFNQKTGRKIGLELEPGTFYVAESGLLVSKVIDLVDTGQDFTFIKLDTGMNDIVRPALYGSVHHVDHLPNSPSAESPSSEADDSHEVAQKYRILGHCCESSDELFAHQQYSVADGADGNSGNSSNSKNSSFFYFSKVEIGDYMIIHGAGAYGASMSSFYNSFPASAELLLDTNGQIITIRSRGNLEDVMRNEISLGQF